PRAATRLAEDPARAAAVPDEHSGRMVLVLRADTGAPVRGASVVPWPGPRTIAAQDGFEERLRTCTLDERPAERTAPPSITDASGRVTLPGLDGGGWVEAAFEGLWGCCEIPPDGAPAVVSLLEDLAACVRVVDMHGAPVAGARVVLHERRGFSGFDLLSARTAANGNAVLRHAGWCLRSRAPEADLALVLCGLLDPPVERDLDAALLGEVVTLVLPATGSCEVAVVDELGRPFPGPFEARLGF